MDRLKSSARLMIVSDLDHTMVCYAVAFLFIFPDFWNWCLWLEWSITWYVLIVGWSPRRREQFAFKIQCSLGSFLSPRFAVGVLDWKVAYTLQTIEEREAHDNSRYNHNVSGNWDYLWKIHGSWWWMGSALEPEMGQEHSHWGNKQVFWTYSSGIFSRIVVAMKQASSGTHGHLL